MSIPAQIKYLTLSILFVVASINFTRTAVNILKSSERLNSAQKEVLALETERESLEKELEYRKTDEFVEEKARNELNMVRPGEKVYIMPDGLGKIVNNLKTIERNAEKSNPQRWMELFF